MKKESKRISWGFSEYEKEALKKAQKKFFTPTIECINKFSAEQQFKIVLKYENFATFIKEKKVFCLNIFREQENGIPFTIPISKSFLVPSVNYKESYGLAEQLDIKQGNNIFYTNINSVISFKANFPSSPRFLEGILTSLKSRKREPKYIYRRLLIEVKDTDMIFPTSILEYDNNHIKFDIESWDRQKYMIGLPFLSTKGMFAKIKIKNK